MTDRRDEERRQRRETEGKAMSKLEEIQAAGSVEELEAISWT